MKVLLQSSKTKFYRIALIESTSSPSFDPVKSLPGSKLKWKTLLNGHSAHVYIHFHMSSRTVFTIKEQHIAELRPASRMRITKTLYFPIWAHLQCHLQISRSQEARIWVYKGVKLFKNDVWAQAGQISISMRPGNPDSLGTSDAFIPTIFISIHLQRYAWAKTGVHSLKLQLMSYCFC